MTSFLVQEVMMLKTASISGSTCGFSVVGFTPYHTALRRAFQVSHDQYLIEATVDELWMCENGSVSPWRGTFQEYKVGLIMTAARSGAAVNDHAWPSVMQHDSCFYTRAMFPAL
jgi:hypothetical protein